MVDVPVPPHKSVRAPGVILVCEVLAKENVEAWKLDALPLLFPFFTTTQCHISLEREEALGSCVIERIGTDLYCCITNCRRLDSFHAMNLCVAPF